MYRLYHIINTCARLYVRLDDSYALKMLGVSRIVGKGIIIGADSSERYMPVAGRRAVVYAHFHLCERLYFCGKGLDCSLELRRHSIALGAFATKAKHYNMLYHNHFV